MEGGKGGKGTRKTCRTAPARVWIVDCGLWIVVCGVWCAVCGVWFAVCGDENVVRCVRCVWCVWCVWCVCGGANKTEAEIPVKGGPNQSPSQDHRSLDRGVAIGQELAKRAPLLDLAQLCERARCSVADVSGRVGQELGESQQVAGLNRS